MIARQGRHAGVLPSREGLLGGDDLHIVSSSGGKTVPRHLELRLGQALDFFCRHGPERRDPQVVQREPDVGFDFRPDVLQAGGRLVPASPGIFCTNWLKS